MAEQGGLAEEHRQHERREQERHHDQAHAGGGQDEREEQKQRQGEQPHEKRGHRAFIKRLYGGRHGPGEEREQHRVAERKDSRHHPRPAHREGQRTRFEHELVERAIHPIRELQAIRAHELDQVGNGNGHAIPSHLGPGQGGDAAQDANRVAADQRVGAQDDAAHDADGVASHLGAGAEYQAGTDVYRVTVNVAVDPEFAVDHHHVFLDLPVDDCRTLGHHHPAHFLPFVHMHVLADNLDLAVGVGSVRRRNFVAPVSGGGFGELT